MCRSREVLWLLRVRQLAAGKKTIHSVKVIEVDSILPPYNTIGLNEDTVIVSTIWFDWNDHQSIEFVFCVCVYFGIFPNNFIFLFDVNSSQPRLATGRFERLPQCWRGGPGVDARHSAWRDQIGRTMGRFTRPYRTVERRLGRHYQRKFPTIYSRLEMYRYDDNSLPHGTLKCWLDGRGFRFSVCY